MSSMNLTDLKDLHRNSGDYIEKEVTVGGIVILYHFLVLTY